MKVVIIGKPRKHIKPKADWEYLENELAKREYTLKTDAIIAMAKLGFTQDISRTITKSRRNGGVIISTVLGLTPVPTGYEAIRDLLRRKRVVISYQLNARGLLTYVGTHWKNLIKGMTPVQIDLLRRLLGFYKDLLAACLRLEKKWGL